MHPETKPNFIWSLFTLKCPRCRRGPLFRDPNPWKWKKTLAMHKDCPECGQPYELEVGFWYGTGYVSYLLTVLFSLVSLAIWWLVVGLSINDDRILWWLLANAILLIGLQPWIMRLSRAVYLYFFVRYDPNYRENPIKSFDYRSESYYGPADPKSPREGQGK